MSKQLHLIAEPKPQYDPQAEARRAEYLERLRQYLQDPDFRAIEGFPIAGDEDILALSDPPYYTACPNPFLPEILEEWQRQRDAAGPQSTGPQSAGPYRREPFAADVSEGKNDPIYNAHSYHTKVPHKAIMRYILHYTEPGDIVFDGFCGTGMTGVAAQLCDDRQAVEALGYRVDGEGVVYDGATPVSRLGARKAVLVDLSPAATFIAYNYNTPVDARAFEQEAQRILAELESECGWMYETWHPHCDDPNRVKGRINYTVWSDVFVCPECGENIIFFEAAFDKQKKKVRKQFLCPNCKAEHSKRSLERAFEQRYDPILDATIRIAKQVPVLINYSVGTKSYEKKLDANDLSLIWDIENANISYPFAHSRMPNSDEARRNDSIGITHVHHFFTKRNLKTLATTFQLLDNSPNYLRKTLFFTFEQAIMGMSKHARYVPTHYSQVNQGLSGTLYISSQVVETSIPYVIGGKIRRLVNVFKRFNQLSYGNSLLTTQSATKLPGIERNLVDYIFVDPPFGGNLTYSALNFIHESWMGILTNSQKEAIINKVQRKKLLDYQMLMERSFQEFYRVLKPGHWMTVEFHNSQNRVWNAIQEALLRAGFVVADVRTLDKKQGSFKQYTTTAATKQDLIISAYKPNGGLEERFRLSAGSQEGVWDFIHQHLAHLPVVVTRPDGALEILAERQKYLLFDRMVAFHIQRGARVPISAATFYQGLHQRFVERDGMYFLPQQVPQYDRARLETAEVAQLTYLVSDEKSAIQWLRQYLNPSLGGRPRNYQDIQPDFLRQLHQARHEVLPELGELLEQNFLQDEEGLWYGPDPNRAADLEALRNKALLREFSAYLEGVRRLLKFRTEAVRAGFAAAWQRNDFETIIRVAERLPELVLQEDPELLMYYDNATLRAG